MMPMMIENFIFMELVKEILLIELAQTYENIHDSNDQLIRTKLSLEKEKKFSYWIQTKRVGISIVHSHLFGVCIRI